MLISKLKKYFLIYFFIVLVLSAFGGGLLIGQLKQVKARDGEMGWEIFQKQNRAPADVDFSLFWKVWNTVGEKFTDGKIDNQKRVYGAIKGMVQSLGDPYTAFMDPDETKEFSQELEGTFEGIGAEVGAREKRIVIIAPLNNSPAERAGLKAGDIILKIDHQDTLNLPLFKAVSLIRGEKGSPVVLTVFREEENKTYEIKIIRDKINVPSVRLKWLKDWVKTEKAEQKIPQEMQNKKIALIEVSRFGDDTDERFRDAARKIVQEKTEGIILDLRNNPGGFLEAAIDLAEEFVDRGQIVVIESFANGKKKEFKSFGSARLKGIPLVVLVNKGSASASEILAGALQDYHLGYIMGEKTFGKGSVQDLERFQNGSSLRVTIAKWLTPSGRLINGKGLDPDQKIESKKEDAQEKIDSWILEAVRYLSKSYPFARY